MLRAFGSNQVIFLICWTSLHKTSDIIVFQPLNVYRETQGTMSFFNWLKYFREFLAQLWLNMTTLEIKFELRFDYSLNLSIIFMFRVQNKSPILHESKKNEDELKCFENSLWLKTLKSHKNSNKHKTHNNLPLY